MKTPRKQLPADLKFGTVFSEHMVCARFDIDTGWSQADLGKKLGLGQARVAQIEGDPGSINVDRLLQILHLLESKLVIELAVQAEQGTKPLGGAFERSDSEKSVVGMFIEGKKAKPTFGMTFKGFAETPPMMKDAISESAKSPVPPKNRSSTLKPDDQARKKASDISNPKKK